MTISEVSGMFDLSADTLRYYERIGLIPPVGRSASGLRDYQEEDLRWVEFIKCMRNAGVSIETLIEYVSLFRQGRATITTRKALLVEQRRQIAAQIEKLKAGLDRLDTKLDGYEERMIRIEDNLKISPD